MVINTRETILITGHGLPVHNPSLTQLYIYIIRTNVYYYNIHVQCVDTQIIIITQYKTVSIPGHGLMKLLRPSPSTAPKSKKWRVKSTWHHLRWSQMQSYNTGTHNTDLAMPASDMSGEINNRLLYWGQSPIINSLCVCIRLTPIQLSWPHHDMQLPHIMKQLQGSCVDYTCKQG